MRALSSAVAHVEIGVSDLERSRRFYVDLLGLRPAEAGDAAGELWLDGGAGLIRLVEVGDQGTPSGWSPDDLQCGIRHLGFKVDDADVHVERLRAAGAPSAVEPFDTMAGVRIAFLGDPDGARLEIVAGAHVYHRLWAEELAAEEAAGLPRSGDPPRFDHVALTVSDLDSALAFYRDRLDMQPIGQLFQDDERGFTITNLKSAGAMLEVFSFDAPTVENPWAPDPLRLGFRAIGVSGNGAVGQVLDPDGTALQVRP